MSETTWSSVAKILPVWPACSSCLEQIDLTDEIEAQFYSLINGAISAANGRVQPQV